MTGDRGGCFVFAPQRQASGLAWIGELGSGAGRMARSGGLDGGASWRGGTAGLAAGRTERHGAAGLAAGQAGTADRVGQLGRRSKQGYDHGGKLGRARRARTWGNGQGRARACSDLDVASKQAGKARQAGRQGKQASRQARQAGKQAGKAGERGCMVGWRRGARGGSAAGTTPRLCVLKLISYYRDSAFDHRHRVGHGERVRS